MRKTKLLTATALGLVLAGAAMMTMTSQAFADTSVSSASTTALKTSSAGNVTIASGGSISLTSGTAITVDSDNTVDLEGPIQMSGSAAGSTGILVTGGHTSGLTINAAITVTDNYTATDTTSPADGVVDGPFADTNQRYGILSTGTTPFVGNVAIASAGAIDVEGDGSYGIRFENNIDGTFSDLSAMTIIGNNATGISLENGATGKVLLGGSISVLGQNSTAVSLAGNFGSSIEVEGSYTNTGYADTTALTGTALTVVTSNPNDMYQAGPLFSISGNVANGVLFEAVPTTDSTNTSTDQDGDGIADTSNTASSLTQYGSAPALRIGSSTADITLGGLTYASTAVSPPSVDYGLLMRGTITAEGVYSGITATAVQLGGLGYGVTIDNGIGVKGTITATAVTADATALSLQSGLTTPQLDVSGTISATTATLSGTTAHAIDILAGASLPEINVSTTGIITAIATGSQGNATAIRDRSNTLTTINNDYLITSSITATDDNGDGVADTIVNTPVAIDTSTNTVGLTINQVATSTTATDGTVTTVTPEIIGSILLGSGNDTINLAGGSIIGNIDFGAGANSFTMTNGSTYTGNLTGSGTVALDISDGTAVLGANTKLNLTSFHVGSSSSLGIVLNTATPTVANFVVSGNAVFDNGATVGLSLNHVLLNPTTFTVMTAANINTGTLNLTDLGDDTPYIYNVVLRPNSTNTTLFADFRLKTQAEGNFSSNEYAALVPVLTAMGQDSGATTAILAQTTKDGFNNVFDQYLPDFSGENLLTLSRGPQAINHTLSSLSQIPDNTDGQYWLQEYGYHTSRDYGVTNGFTATGFAFAGGREQAIGGRQMLGVYLSYNSATPTDTFAIGAENLVNSDLTVGGYWRLRDEGFKAWVHAGAGYTSFQSTRVILNTYVSHTAKADWSGYSYSAGAGASYEYHVGSFSLTPQLLTDFYDLSENKHSEKDGGDDFDLTVGQRNSHLFDGQALVNFTYNKWFVKPEVWVGYKDNISAQIADTVANFTGGTPFTLTGGDIKGGGAVGGFRISADNQYSYFSLEGNYESMPDYTNWSVAVRTRFQF